MLLSRFSGCWSSVIYKLIHLFNTLLFPIHSETSKLMTVTVVLLQCRIILVSCFFTFTTNYNCMKLSHVLTFSLISLNYFIANLKNKRPIKKHTGVKTKLSWQVKNTSCGEIVSLQQVKRSWNTWNIEHTFRFKVQTLPV